MALLRTSASETTARKKKTQQQQQTAQEARRALQRGRHQTKQQPQQTPQREHRDEHGKRVRTPGRIPSSERSRLTACVPIWVYSRIKPFASVPPSSLCRCLGVNTGVDGSPEEERGSQCQLRLCVWHSARYSRRVYGLSFPREAWRRNIPQCHVAWRSTRQPEQHTCSLFMSPKHRIPSWAELNMWNI